MKAKAMALAGLLLAGGWIAGCGPRGLEPVVVPELRQVTPVPVVFVPGVLGSKLRRADSGRVLWGRGMNVILPHDGGAAIALPIGLEKDAADGVEAFKVFDEVRLLGVKRVVYRGLTDLFVDHGYHHGNLDAPRPDDTFFLFAYDWRRPSPVAARELGEALERLRRTRGDERLPVHLVCQSNGAYVCRYFLKYGGASMEDAEAGRATPSPGVDVRSLVLVGTANGGSLRTLRELNRGRLFVRRIGRRFQPETLFTFRSLYQDLPAYRDDLFLDEDGEPLDVDLYDAETWRRYGWSIYGEKARRRLAKKPRAELFGDPEARDAFLEGCLDRGRRLQRLLAADVPGFGDTRVYLVQNVHEPTPDRAVLVRGKGGSWRTLFTGDPELLARPRLHALASAPGDGHATRASQLWLSPQERAALVGEPFDIEGGHFDIVLAADTRRHLLEVLTRP